MRTIIPLILLLFFGINSFGQKMTGIGGELSAFSIKPNVRAWLSRTNGFEVFGGISAETSDLKPNDFEGGLKYLNCFMYDLNYRLYFGLMGKWKYVNLEGTHLKKSLPVAGIFVGKEWFDKRKHLKGFAIELGYQYGTMNYNNMAPDNQHIISKEVYEEFPLIFNIRYSYYKKR